MRVLVKDENDITNVQMERHDRWVLLIQGKWMLGMSVWINISNKIDILKLYNK